VWVHHQSKQRYRPVAEAVSDARYGECGPQVAEPRPQYPLPPGLFPCSIVVVRPALARCHRCIIARIGSLCSVMSVQARMWHSWRLYHCTPWRLAVSVLLAAHAGAAGKNLI